MVIGDQGSALTEILGSGIGDLGSKMRRKMESLMKSTPRYDPASKLFNTKKMTLRE